jgi:hypothetical protein
MKKRFGWTPVALVAALTAVPGCKTRSAPNDAGPVAQAIVLDAGRPLALQLHIEVRTADGGVLSERLEGLTPPLVPVTQALEVRANLPLHNYRLRILDEIDRALASDDVPEETPDGLRYRVALLSPLRAGHRYTVLLDAQSGATLDDGSGTAINEQRFEFRTEGEREKDAPVKHAPSKRRHRRGDGS